MMTFDVSENNDLFTGGDGNLAIARDEQAVKKQLCSVYQSTARRNAA